MNDLLQLALNNEDKLVSIYQVPTGKECNCFCPKCREPLIAKNKNKTDGQILKHGQKEAHFSHEAESKCVGAEETAIHMIAKSVLQEFKTLLIPPLIVNSCKLVSERKETFDKVEIEKAIKTESFTIIPDAILYKKHNEKDYKILVEFKKTHAVDLEKKEKIKELNVSCIEIDINHIEIIKHNRINILGIISRLEEDIQYKDWIYNSKSKMLYSNYQRKKEQQHKKAIAESERNRKHYYNHLNEIENQGYKFIKIFEYEKYKENYSLIENEDDETYIEEKLYCPKIIVHERKQKIDLIECMDCEYYLETVVKEKRNHVACGFENKIKK